MSFSGWPSSWSSLWLGEISTWNHTVAAFVKAVPDLHHYLRHNVSSLQEGPHAHPHPAYRLGFEPQIDSGGCSFLSETYLARFSLLGPSPDPNISLLALPVRAV